MVQIAPEPANAPMQADAPDADRPALVVETTALAMIQGVLDELALSATLTEGHEALGLTRVTLIDANDEPVDDLDALLAEVRRRLSARYGGWVPPMGKEREARSTLTRGGHPKVTSTLLPEPVTGDQPDRGAGPLGGHPRVLTVPSALHGGHPRVLGGHPRVLGGHPQVLGGLPSVAFSATDVRDDDAAWVRVGLVDTPENDLSQPGEPWQAHSTFVTAIVRTTAPHATVVLRGALQGKGGFGSGWAVANAIVELAIDEQVDIVLLPLACFTADGEPPLLMQRAIAAVPEATVVIAAAGNQTLDPGWSALGRGPTSPAWPAALPSVAAVGVDGRRLDPPQTAPVQPWVEALTDQLDFIGPFFTGDIDMDGLRQTFTGKARWRGTSFCAAYAAGLLAERMATDGSHPQQAWQALLDDAPEAAPFDEPEQK